MVDELAESIFTIPFNVHEDGSSGSILPLIDISTSNVSHQYFHFLTMKYASFPILDLLKPWVHYENVISIFSRAYLTSWKQSSVPYHGARLPRIWLVNGANI